MEGRGGIKLQKCQQWWRERELKKLEEQWGRRPLKRGSKKELLEGKRGGSPTTRPGWAGTRSGRPLPGLSPAWAGQTAEKHPTRKRTYFDHPDSVFYVLGSLETQRSALQDHA